MKHILLRALAVALACGACASVSCGGNASTKAKTRQTEAARPAALEIDEPAGFGRLARRQDRHDRGRLHPYVQARCAQDLPHGQRRHADRSCRVASLGSLRSAVREPYRARHGYARRTARGRGLPRGLGGADEGADRRTARHDRGRMRRREGRTAGDGRHRRGSALPTSARRSPPAKAAEGKDYLSFYYVTATSYEIEQ